MKRLLFLFIPLLLGLVSCGGDDNDEPLKVVSDSNIEWLKNNIEGEWHASHVYNSVSYTWVSASIGYQSNSFIFRNGEVEIKGFNTLNGVHTYQFSVKDGQTMIKIGDREFGILSVDPTEKKVTFFNFAKLVKQ